ncbi:cmgc clk protein kinase [Lichtheimia corymbifera JMRC:FSU:9682]|uniref:Cmgc clk protein kinase n=1 Tax=Lichtheimia corymbifera JMRC:FSU:9682 TaxID=1263082 RepID=A0A068RQQ2_9FUNG|nr:cmgc clk protein kinase [Lichtheimia corymbifera JMRC:FSU:9682]
MATSALLPTKRNRESNWEAEYYRNGYPREIIVIEDSPPPTPHDRSQSRSNYTVVQAPTPPPSMPSFTSSSHTRISNYHQQQLQYQTTTYPHPSLYHTHHHHHHHHHHQQRLPTKRQRHYTPAHSMQQQHHHHHPFDTSYYHTHSKRRRRDIHPPPPPPPPLPQPMNDADGHFIVRRGHFLKNRYQMDQVLGQGTYGKVVRCYDHVRKCHCAVKIIRAIPKYRDASQTEIRILNTLKKHDQLNFNQCIHLVEWFEHYNHVCMVFELLDQSIYDFLKSNDFTPFPLVQIQHFAKQLLNSVAFIHELEMIHTDLKPENILLKNHDYDTVLASHTKRGTTRILRKTDIVLIDFGSATFQHGYHSAVVSTRHYRAPEIILGLGWSYACDMWSLGCILIEFFTGEAVFQTHDNLEHLAMMERVLGKLPGRMARKASPDAAKYFENNRLRYNPAHHASRRDVVNNLKPLRSIINPRTRATMQLLDLLEQMLMYDPSKRITARQALRHPFFQIDFDKYGREI